MIHLRYFFPAILILFVPSLLKAGQGSHYSIEWLPPYENKSVEGANFRSLNFNGATLNENYLPVFIETKPITANASAIKVELKNVVTEPLKETELIRYPEKIGVDFEVSAHIVKQKKNSFSKLSVLPIRKKGNSYERLVSFDLDMQPVYSTANRIAGIRNYAASSKLASGTWFRIGVVQNGIHKIDYPYLKKLGVDVDNIDPHQLRLYGNGGGGLPFANIKPRYDDLQQNAIYINSDSAGNHFGQNDYILFYGTGQTRWSFDTTLRTFTHQINNYADTTYYFLRVDPNQDDSPKRILPPQELSTPPNTIVTSFDDYLFHEADLVNHLKSGREWYGEGLDNLNNSKSFTFSFPNISASDTVFLRMNLIGRSVSVRNGIAFANSFTVNVNGNSLFQQSFNNVGGDVQDNFANSVSVNKFFFTGNPTISVNAILNSNNPNVQAWINYIELNARRNLSAGSTNQFQFRDLHSVGAGNVSEFRISGAPQNLLVWDVTDPLNVVAKYIRSSSPGNASFVAATNELHEFVVSDSRTYYSPFAAGQVENQNLHALGKANMIIVTNPLFLSQANQLADFHRTHDGLSVVVATTRQIFNEFSSGAEDVCAIRDFVKMFYDRGSSTSEIPKYLLLFGDASYDNKHRLSSNTNYVTSFESAGSLNETQTYMTDDFFGFLDDAEGDSPNNEIIDISVGRLPVKSTTEADLVVKKIIHYVQGNNSGSTSNSTFGDWRNTISFVADDQDGNTHFSQAQGHADTLYKNHPVFNIDKLYLDAYNQETTPGGQRYPDGHKAIIDRVQRGTLMITYIGHGGETGWGHERILEVEDINNWSNYDHLAAFLTATCEFTRVDDPGRTSAGELVFLNPKGGGICLFTTSRLAFSTSNDRLCKRFYAHAFEKINGRMPTIGEIFEQTKSDVYQDQYVRNFILIGDPAVRLNYPQWSIRTNSINGILVSDPTDSLKALSKITIAGEIQDGSGNKMTNFNGIIYPTVFDKMATYYTLANDPYVPVPDNNPSYVAPFSLQKNVIYRGKASVVNGDFLFSFMVPKDISYQYGLGKLSYYADNGTEDAAGYYSKIVVGGYNNNNTQDAKGPDIQLYINDDKFVFGGLTDKDPILYAIVKDSSGVNTVGTGIGHDMMAELDANSNKLYVLNDYYENDLNSYQKGQVKYQFKDLASGPHTLKFKVWDVYNNSSEAQTDFVVSETAQLALSHVLNYPNPFTTHTTFMFEHNRPFITLDVQVQIFTISGRLIKTISDKIITKGYRSDNLEWNGLDDFGDRIGKGVYIYKLRIRTADGDYADKFEKLVILR